MYSITIKGVHQWSKSGLDQIEDRNFKNSRFKDRTVCAQTKHESDQFGPSLFFKFFLQNIINQNIENLLVNVFYIHIFFLKSDMKGGNWIHKWFIFIFFKDKSIRSKSVLKRFWVGSESRPISFFFFFGMGDQNGCLQSGPIYFSVRTDFCTHLLTTNFKQECKTAQYEQAIFA